MTDLVARPLPIRNLAELNDVTITSIADGEIIVWDSGTSQYINNTLAEAGISATSHTHTASEVTDFSTAADARIASAVINALSDVTITAAASGDFLRHNGTAWVDVTIAASDLPVMVGDSGSGGTKGAVPAPAAGDAAANKYLKADGTWATVAGGGASAIDDLTDVTITAAASGDFLRHNGTAWVDATIAASDLPTMVGDSGSGGTKGAVPAPAAGDAAANKYLKADGTWATVAGGSGSAHWHDPVECVTTANVDLAGGGIANGTTHDGVTVSTGQRVLVQAQTDGIENGIYVVPAYGSASRASDMAAGFNASGDVIQIKAGSNYADWTAYITSNSSTVGTHPLTVALRNNSVTSIELEHYALNFLVNSSFQYWTNGATSTTVATPTAFTAVADDVYGGPDRWNFLRDTVALQIKQVDGRAGYSSKAIEIKNASGGGGGKFALQQILECVDTIPLRGQVVGTSIQINPQTETDTYSIVLIEHVGTADVVVSDVIYDWAESQLTEWDGADGLFTSSADINVIASASTSCASGAWKQLSASGTVGASANNLMALVILHGSYSLSNNASVVMSEFQLYRGSQSPRYVESPWTVTELACQRWHIAMRNNGSDWYISGRKIANNKIRAWYNTLPGLGMRAAPTVTNNVSGWTGGNPGTTTVAGYDEAAATSLTITGGLTFAAAAYDRFRWSCSFTAATSFSGTTGNYIECTFGEDVVLHFSANL